MAKSDIPVRQEPLKYEIRIPGGTAKFWKRTELSPRRQREIDVVQMQILPRLRELAVAQKIIVDGKVVDESNVLDGIPVGLTRDEARTLTDLNEVIAWAYLRSWSLKRDGEPLPLPATPDDLLDLPGNIHAALIAHAAKLYQDGLDPFTVEAVEDSESPTTA